MTWTKQFHKLSLLLVVLGLTLGVVSVSHAQRFVRPINSIPELIASNPNDPHTNVFIPQGPSGPGLFYQWRKNDGTATNANQSVLGSTWPGASGRWYKIPLIQSESLGDLILTNITGEVQFVVPTNRLVSRISGFVNVKDYGAIGDGGSHPLSSVYGSLGAAQAVYSFATNLTQQLDWAACKKASNVALGADGSEHGATTPNLNVPIYIPSGNYYFGSDTWTIRNAVGIHIFGDGRLSTTIRGNITMMAFDGLWFSTIEKFSLLAQTSSALTALDVDGNVPGQPYATRGVQANTFRDLLLDGGGSSYAFTMTRQGSSGGQGSENLYINVHLSNAALACYYQLGFNALANQFVGGNCQNYSKNGIQIAFGSVNVYGTGFQSTKSYTQILNDGWDIVSDQGGSFDPFIISGCRTESLRFARLGPSTPGVIIGCKGQVATPGWFANHAYTLNQAVVVTNAALPPRNHLFKVTTAGTTGGTEPVWPTDGVSTIADGTAVWQEVVFIAIDNGSGHVTDSSMPVGRIVTANLRVKETQANYTAYEEDEIILADTSSGNITITLPPAQSVTSGKPVYIKKGHVNNVLTVVASLFEDALGTRTIPAGSYGYLIATSIGGGFLPQRWFIVGSDLSVTGNIYKRTAVSSSYASALSDTYIAATATLTNSLPAANTVSAGRYFIVKDVNGNTITVRPNGADTIDGVAADDTLTSRQSRTYVSNGVSNWEVLE